MCSLYQRHQFPFSATTVSCSFSPSFTSLLLKWFFPKMQILCTPPTILQWLPIAPSVPSNLLVGKNKPLYYPALAYLSLLSFIMLSYPCTCCHLRLINLFTLWLGSFQLIPRVSSTGKPFLVLFPTLNYPDELPFFAPVNPHGTLFMFLSWCSSDCMIAVCCTIIPPTCLGASWGPALCFILIGPAIAPKLAHSRWSVSVGWINEVAELPIDGELQIFFLNWAHGLTRQSPF